MNRCHCHTAIFSYEGDSVKRIACDIDHIAHALTNAKMPPSRGASWSILLVADGASIGVVVFCLFGMRAPEPVDRVLPMVLGGPVSGVHVVEDGFPKGAGGFVRVFLVGHRVEHDPIVGEVAGADVCHGQFSISVGRSMIFLQSRIM
jgi:hypothetical protein